MKNITIKDIIENADGTLYFGNNDTIENVTISSVSTNSKEITDGALFVPIIGERVDAHKFVRDSLEQGAVASLVSKDIDTAGLPENVYCIKVDDTLRAIQRLAAWYRRRFDLPVIGVTGSVGKTTTKEMISTALEAGKKVLKTIGNRNSQLGVALMMFELSDDYDIAVFEMGISEPDEMHYLTEIAKPETAVITNIGVSHIAQLGSRENIRREKLDIVRGFDGEGTVYVCGNDPLLKETADYFKNNGSIQVDSNKLDSKDSKEGLILTAETRNILEKSTICTFGTSEGCDYKGEDIKAENKGISFIYNGTRIQLSVDGVHNVHNALSAIAIADQYGVDINSAIRALEGYKPLSMRGEITEHNGITIIDDTYNASPDSMRSAIQVLWSRQCSGRKFAVLADALELGEGSKELHREVGLYIADGYKNGEKLDCLVTVGEDAACIADEVRQLCGVDNDKNIVTPESKGHCTEGSGIEVVSYDNREDAAKYLIDNLKSGDMVILKGSRGMKMDEVVSELKQYLA